MKPNISKFSVAELFSNESGKTSGSGFVGLVVSVVGTFCFFLGCIDKMFFSNSADIITQSIILVGIGTTLLGVRKVVGKPVIDARRDIKELQKEDQEVKQINS